MRHLGLLSLIACLAAASGCNLCCWGKRNAELTGPTDVRKSQLWCLGEDAIFHQPMGPSSQNYGMKKTSWREWPDDGSPCANGSCGPMLIPGSGPAGSMPSSHPQPTPATSPDRQLNPFRDDPQPAPATDDFSAKPPQTPHRIGATHPKEFQSLFNAPATAPKTAQLEKPRSRPTTKPAIPPRVISVAAPAVPPALIPKSATAPPEKAPDRRKMTISEPIDTPTRKLAPIRAPGAITQTSATSTADPSETRAALASLQQMIDVTPESSDASHVRPAVILNEFTPVADPFELSTRSTLAKKSADPELAEQTLSALGSMMSDGTSAGEN